jgi:hypothetical protein
MRNSLLIAAVLAAGSIAGSAVAQQLPAAPTVAVAGGIPGLVQMGGVGVPQAYGYTFSWSQNAAPVSSFTSDPGFVERSHGRP